MWDAIKTEFQELIVKIFFFNLWLLLNLRSHNSGNWLNSCLNLWDDYLDNILDSNVLKNWQIPHLITNEIVYFQLLSTCIANFHTWDSPFLDMKHGSKMETTFPCQSQRRQLYGSSQIKPSTSQSTRNFPLNFKHFNSSNYHKTPPTPSMPSTTSNSINPANSLNSVQTPSIPPIPSIHPSRPGSLQRGLS